MSKREDILVAAADLFWLHGYEATSPRMIQAESRAGQGSFYHHFKSKSELASEVLDDVSQTLIINTKELLTSDKSPSLRIRQFLRLQRNFKRGCKLGRYSHEHAIVGDEQLRAPLDGYFRSLVKQLTRTIKEAQSIGELPEHLNASNLATTIAGTIQGAYVLARATNSPAMLKNALAGLEQLLDSLSLQNPPSTSKS